MAWVNQKPIRTDTPLDELPEGETIFISINRRASVPGFNILDTAQVMDAAADAWVYTEERMAGRTTAVVTVHEIVAAVFHINDYARDRNNGRKGSFSFTLDGERTDLMRGLTSPYRRKRGQIAGIVFVGDPLRTQPRPNRSPGHAPPSPSDESDRVASLVERARVRTSALEEARGLFADAGIEFPPIPERLTPGFHRIDDWCYATRDVSPFEMYMAHRYPLEVMTETVDDYFAVSQAGHGINSYSLNYDLVYGWVALFVQVGWGGVYMNEAAQAAAVAAAFARCSGVIEALEQLPARPATGRGRLVVVQSDFRESNVCRWLPEPISADHVKGWLERGQVEGGTALDAAASWLIARVLDGAELV